MEQRTDEWKAARLGKFTASEVYKLMGKPKGAEEWTVTAETYIMQKVAEELTIGKNTFSSAATDWGTEMESLAIYHYENITGNKVLAVGFISDNTNYGSSPDGLVGDRGTIEVKCPYNSENHVWLSLCKDLKKECPEYYWQVQMNMMVTNRIWCDFISFDPRINHDSGIKIKNIAINNEDIELLKIKLDLAAKKKQEILTEFLK